MHSVPRRNWVNIHYYEPKNNMGPGMYFPVSFSDRDGKRNLQAMKWGLVPSFTNLKNGSKPDHFVMFNARSETVESKPSFRRIVQSQRCLVILNGFYEWKSEGRQKQPYYVHCEGEKTLKIACVFDTWMGSTDNEPMYTFSMLTCEANPSLRWLHHRQPLFLSDSEAEAWIDNANPPPHGVILRGRNDEIKPEDRVSYIPSSISHYPVTSKMSSISYQEEDACAPVKPSKSITSFFNRSPQDTRKDVAKSKRNRNTEGSYDEKSDLDTKSPTPNQSLETSPSAVSKSPGTKQKSVMSFFKKQRVE